MIFQLNSKRKSAKKNFPFSNRDKWGVWSGGVNVLCVLDDYDESNR